MLFRSATNQVVFEIEVPTDQGFASLQDTPPKTKPTTVCGWTSSLCWRLTTRWQGTDGNAKRWMFS
jgi:hypothetical protein